MNHLQVRKVDNGFVVTFTTKENEIVQVFTDFEDIRMIEVIAKFLLHKRVYVKG